MTRGSTIAAMALAVVLAGCAKTEESRPATQAAPVNGIQLYTVTATSKPLVYEATGTTKAQLNATLSAQVTARVTGVSVHEGDPVRFGQTLITLDPREMHAAVDLAGASVRAATAGVGIAMTAAVMEDQTSAARISQAEAQVVQAKASARVAQSKLDLALAGPRPQERMQAKIAVQQAESSLHLAKTELDRTTRLVQAGAIAGRQLDTAQNAYDQAKAQYDNAIQAQKITDEGTRAEEIRAARDAVAQANAAITQAIAGVSQAHATALQTQTRRDEIRAADAQVGQTNATLRSAKVTLANAIIQAPFDGIVVSRLADPGTMAAPGVPLLGIEGGDLRLEAVVPEGVLSKIAIGSTAQVRLDALAGSAVSAKVAEIVPQGDQTTHSFLVKMTIPRSGAMKSGMFGRAIFRTGTSSGLYVPERAIWQREGLNYVYSVNSANVVRLRIVTVGKAGQGQSEVLSGLAPNDRIVTDGIDRVSDGSRISQ